MRQLPGLEHIARDGMPARQCPGVDRRQAALPAQCPPAPCGHKCLQCFVVEEEPL